MTEFEYTNELYDKEVDLIIKFITKELTSIRKNKKNLLVFVHGDTMTCVVGALAARITRCQVVHVEAGLRSNDWRNPFPEEIDRIVTARLAQYHYSPDEIAVKNLAGRKGTVVNTGGNTARDSMRLMQDVVNRKDDGEPFTLVSLHRAELLGNESVLISTIKELIECSSNNRLVMVIDALTRSTLEQLNLLDLLQASNIELHEKMAYPDFLEFVIGAERVVTDSGGLQEECGFLEIPCLVHRKDPRPGPAFARRAQADAVENYHFFRRPNGRTTPHRLASKTASDRPTR